VVDREHLESAPRKWNGVHSEAGAEIDGTMRCMGHEAKSIQLSLATCQGSLHSPTHPRVDRRQVTCIVIAYRLHGIPYKSASERMCYSGMMPCRILRNRLNLLYGKRGSRAPHRSVALCFERLRPLSGHCEDFRPCELRPPAVE